MSITEIVEVAATVIVSLGGGGALVLGLSNFLGKLWADRALEKQKHEFSKLNTELAHELDIVSRRIQTELDALSHLRKLITETEFQKIRELWKKIAAVRTAYHNLPRSGFRLAFPDKDLQHKHEVGSSLRFSTCLSELFEVWSGEMLSIPENVADEVEKLINVARLEELYALQHPDPFEPGAMAAYDANSRAQFFDQRAQRLVQFVSGSKELEGTMRRYLRGNAGDGQPRS